MSQRRRLVMGDWRNRRRPKVPQMIQMQWIWPRWSTIELVNMRRTLAGAAMPVTV